jgi:hypothetical protein
MYPNNPMMFTVSGFVGCCGIPGTGSIVSRDASGFLACWTVGLVTCSLLSGLAHDAP